MNSRVVSLGFSGFAGGTRASVAAAGLVFSMVGKISLSLVEALLHNVKCAAPARDVREIVEDVGKTSQAVIIRGEARGGVVVHGPVDQQRASDDVLAWHEAPVAAVQAVLTVIAEHKIRVGR